MLDDLAVAFAVSFVVGLSGALSPGPLLAFTIRESARHGWSAGPLVSLGHALLELGVVVILVLGLGRFFQGETARAIIGLVGGGVILWMAWGTVQTALRERPDFHPRGDAPRRSKGGPILGGVVVSLSNPFWSLWWLTVGAGLLARYYPGPLGLWGVGAVYIGHILSDFVWYSAVALAIATGRRLMTRPVYAGILLACALFLAFMGGLFLYTGIRTVVG
ncbi:MAG: LysE family translocator [Dehalococcoidia bacterium]|nr:LysE family translocator [Dehalococcoidia bacterium]MDW8120479.1 LysE family transporter [Chloroflexota bacterium]